MKTRTTALVAIIMSCLSLFVSAEEITKETLTKICPKLEIKKKGLDSELIMIEINIPAAEARFKRLFQAWLIITDQAGNLALRTPMLINTSDGAKRISVDLSPEMLKNARIDLDCKKDPTMSILDTTTLVLPSLVDAKN